MDNPRSEGSPPTRPSVDAPNANGTSATKNTPNQHASSRPKTERRREQCRRNQQRYRDRQRDHETELIANVDQLRRQVDRLRAQRLREQHQMLQERSLSSSDSAVQTIVEYYRLLRYGFQDHRIGTPLASQQVAFLQAVVDDNVCMGDARGRDVFLDQLRLWATIHDGFVMHLHRVDVIHGPDHTTAIHQDVQSELTISLRSIRHIFPHLLQARYQAITWKLLGARLTCPSWGLQICDARGKIIHVAWSIDLVAALQRVLTLEETAIALGHAQIKRDAYLLLQ